MPLPERFEFPELNSSGSAEPQGNKPGTEPVAGRKEAMERAGRLLTERPRSEHEIRTRLRAARFDREVVEETIARLTELGLLDDLAFATQWVGERSRTRGKGPMALLDELYDKGIDRVTAEEALMAAGVDEAAQAREVAAGLARRVARYPLETQADKLYSMLARRGFSPEAVKDAVRSVLPPEGWD